MVDGKPGTQSVSKTAKVFQFRRLLLLTSLAGLGGAALILSPGSGPGRDLPSLSVAARAGENQSRPAGFADVVEKVKPAVISVRVKIDNGPQASGDEENGLPFRPGSPLDRFFRRFGRPEDGLPGTPRGPRGHNYAQGQGSGFFISADGYAVTNNHVVDKSESVQVTTDDGKTYTAKVIGTDARTDLALIKVDGGGDDLPFARLAENPPRVGDWVLAVGNPFGLGGTVTAGILSARGRDIGAGPYDDFLQIDAPVNKGNSGGPTFDVDGDVIGVNTAIFSPSGGSVGIAFAIPADTVRTVIAQLKDKGSVMRGFIGVQIQSVTPEIAEGLGLKRTEGALVAEPQSGSPAAKAGIESGDVITAVDGHPVKDARDLAKRIGGMAPGTAVSLGVLHKGQDRTLSMTLGELPKERQAKAEAGREPRENSGTQLPKLGLTLSPAADVEGAGTEGVAVTAVDPDSPAAERGFKTGDVILDVGGKTVSTPSELREALREARVEGKRAVLLRVKTGTGMRFVALPLGRT